MRQALAAGKVVLSEKPAGPTVAAVKEVLDWMQASGIPAARWSVQENYRGESGLVMAAELARSGALGRLVKADLVAELPMNPGSRYYASAWRRQLPGSFLLEGGVHFVAALRLVCAAAGAGEPGRVSALLTRGSEGVPGPDTLVGWARFDGGVPAGVSITQAGAIPRLCVTLVGTQVWMAVWIARGVSPGARGRASWPCAAFATPARSTPPVRTSSPHGAGHDRGQAGPVGGVDCGACQQLHPARRVERRRARLR